MTRRDAVLAGILVLVVVLVLVSPWGQARAEHQRQGEGAKLTTQGKGPQTTEPEDPLLPVRRDALAGKVPWTRYFDKMDELGRGGPFDSSSFVSRPGNYSVLKRDGRGKFVTLRDLFARRIIDLKKPLLDRDGKPIEIPADQVWSYDHAVSVATPHGLQPRWLNEVDRTKSDHLGRMLRETLGVLPATHGNNVATTAYVNMPGTITIPRLHVHGVWRSPNVPVTDWAQFVKAQGYQKVADAGDFELFASSKPGAHSTNGKPPCPFIAIAKPELGGTSKLSEATDKLLGTMFLSVAGRAFDALNDPSWHDRRALATGWIGIDSTDSQIVVRLQVRSKNDAAE